MFEGRYITKANAAIGETDVLLGAVDVLLRKLEDYLHRRKRWRAKVAVGRLEERAEELRVKQEKIRASYSRIVDEIRRLQQEKESVYLGDVLTLGIGYLLRQKYLDHRQKRFVRELEAIDGRVEGLKAKQVAIEERIAALKRKAEQEKPSLMGRIIGILRTVLSLVAAIMAFIAEQFVSGLIALASAAL